MNFVVPAPKKPALLPTHAINTFWMPAEQSRDIRRQIVDGTFRLEGRAAPELGDRVRSRIWFLSDMLVANSEAEPNTLCRSRDLIRHNPMPVLKIWIYRSGETLLIDGDQHRRIRPGQIHFVDHDRPHRQISSHQDHSTIAVPHRAVGYDPSVHPANFSIGLETAQGRLLRAGLGSVLNDIDTVTANEAAGLAYGVAGLIQGILAGAVDSHDESCVRQARIVAMKQYIDRNLADPDLGIEALLQHFGASRATIYREFADEGGLRHYILERRLHRAYRALAEAAPVRGAVQAAAEQSGFQSLAHFSRRFSQHFGVTPSDIVGQWLPGHDRSAQGDPTTPASAPDYRAEIAALYWSYRRFA